MKIVIAGAGQVGATLAAYLSVNHDVVVIDHATQKLDALQNRMDIQTVEGSASQPDILAQANLQEADMLIAVTNSDDTNITACRMAHAYFHTPRKIARIRYPQLDAYPDIYNAEVLSIDMVINPAKLVTKRLAQQVQHPGSQLLLTFGLDRLAVGAIRIESDSQLIGRKVSELDHLLEERYCHFLGIVRNNQFLQADESTFLAHRDTLYYAAAMKDMQSITFQLIGETRRYRRIMITGAGNIGLSLAASLETDYHVKILDHSRKNCENAVELLDRATVLLGNAADTNLMLTENIAETDVFFALTNDDEVNIMSAILAKRFGARMTVALVNRESYARYLIESSPDITTAVSPQKITGNAILKYLRRGDFVAIHALPNSDAEIVEIYTQGDASNCAAIGKSLADLQLPSGVTLVGIVRNKKVLLGMEPLTIKPHDYVVLLVTDPKHIEDIERCFQVSAAYIA